VFARARSSWEPGPHDPIFLDPNTDEPWEMPPLDPAIIESVAAKAGIRPEIGFAVTKTGVSLTAENAHLYTDEDKAEFQAAIEEYRECARRQDA
jgi:hypothetical protein